MSGSRDRVRYHAAVSPLGPLLDEPPEPMTREQFLAVRKRLKDSWNGSVTLAKNDAQPSPR